MSKDTIYRQAAIDALDKRFDNVPMEQTTEILLLRKDLRELPSAQPEQKTGTWELMFNGQFKGGAYWFSCSKCNRIVPEVRNGGWNYCPNCGADMREGEDG